jgi:hypothetical protein
MRVYLAGAITGLTYNACTDWREQVTRELAQLGHIGVSPMRGKDYLRELYGDGVLAKHPITGFANAIATEEALQTAWEQFPMSGEQGIFGRDTFDVRHCEVLLAVLVGLDRVSIGTCMEIQRGYDLDRYVLVVMEPGSLHDHPFVRRAASIIVPTLEQAMQVIAAMGQPYRSSL